MVLQDVDLERLKGRNEKMKDYLGDAVYAELKMTMVKLTTNNGIGDSNTIFLEPEIVSVLMVFLAKIYKTDDCLHLVRKLLVQCAVNKLEYKEQARVAYLLKHFDLSESLEVIDD